MKILCNLTEFAHMVRDCENGTCYNCVLNHVCEELRKNNPELGEKNLIEHFVTSDSIIRESDDPKSPPKENVYNVR